MIALVTIYREVSSIECDDIRSHWTKNWWQWSSPWSTKGFNRQRSPERKLWIKNVWNYIHSIYQSFRQPNIKPEDTSLSFLFFFSSFFFLLLSCCLSNHIWNRTVSQPEDNIDTTDQFKKHHESIEPKIVFPQERIVSIEFLLFIFGFI